MTRIASCQPNHAFTTATQSQNGLQFELTTTKSNNWFISTSRARPSNIRLCHPHPTNNIATAFPSTPELAQDSIPEGLYKSRNRKRTLSNVLDLAEIEDENRRKSRKQAFDELLPTAPARQPIQRSEGQQSHTRSPNRTFTTSETQNTARPFACPFYKYNPEKYGTKAWRSCIGPGWTIPRLKEHIYRRHYSRTHRCDRCFEGFETAAELTQHRRADVQCPKQPVNQDFERIDDAQKSQIQKKTRGKSDAEKWCEIYRTIFRLVASAEIPSPYYEAHICGIGRGDNLATNTDSLTDFEEDLTSRLKHDLDPKTETDIRICLQMIQSFRQSRSATQLTVKSDIPSLIQDASNSNGRALEPHHSSILTTEPAIEALGDPSQRPEKLADSVSFLDYHNFPSGPDNVFSELMFPMIDAFDDELVLGVPFEV